MIATIQKVTHIAPTRHFLREWALHFSIPLVAFTIIQPTRY